MNHGFLRARDGTITTFDPHGAANTDPTGINQAGYITGDYSYANGATAYGFLRSPDGTFITFDPPGSVLTKPASINSAGAITGWYQDANFIEHGFLRIPGHREEE